MNILISEYATDRPQITGFDRQAMLDAGFHVGGKPQHDTHYCVSWGDPANKCRVGTMETGFFHDALHIDTIGLYASCSLNTPQARGEILSYKAPKSAADIVLSAKVPSKYPQVGASATWEGVVLALQNPGDRSIHRGSSTEDYYRFVESACRHYGRHLYLKLHPWNSGEVEKRFRETAADHGSAIGRVNHSVLEKCRFVLVYNSTFAIDCLIRGVRVAEYAPGYFWQAPGIHYTAGEFPDDVPDLRDEGYKLCDFLVWRYCWKRTGRIVDIVRTFAESRKLFPLTEELSYGASSA